MLAFIKDKSEIEKYQNNSPTLVKTYLNVRKSLWVNRLEKCIDIFIYGMFLKRLSMVQSTEGSNSQRVCLFVWVCDYISLSM